MAKSADGRGRTLWQMIFGTNIKDETPPESKQHNPLQALVGKTRISFDHDDDENPDLYDETLGGPVEFLVDGIRSYDTHYGQHHYYHTDYLLKGVRSGVDHPVRFVLRIVEGDSLDKLGQCQLLRTMDEFGEDREPEFEQNVLCSDSGIFEVDEDNDGNKLDPPIQYWRVDDVRDPYTAVCSKVDGNRVLDTTKIKYWDYCREMIGENGEKLGKEYVWIEKEKHFFTLLLTVKILSSSDDVQVL